MFANICRAPRPYLMRVSIPRTPHRGINHDIGILGIYSMLVSNQQTSTSTGRFPTKLIRHLLPCSHYPIWIRTRNWIISPVLPFNQDLNTVLPTRDSRFRSSDLSVMSRTRFQLRQIAYNPCSPDLFPHGLWVSMIGIEPISSSTKSRTHEPSLLLRYLITPM